MLAYDRRPTHHHAANRIRDCTSAGEGYATIIIPVGSGPQSCATRSRLPTPKIATSPKIPIYEQFCSKHLLVAAEATPSAHAQQRSTRPRATTLAPRRPPTATTVVSFKSVMPGKHVIPRSKMSRFKLKLGDPVRSQGKRNKEEVEAAGGGYLNHNTHKENKCVRLRNSDGVKWN